MPCFYLFPNKTCPFDGFSDPLESYIASWVILFEASPFTSLLFSFFVQDFLYYIKGIWGRLLPAGGCIFRFVARSFSFFIFFFLISFDILSFAGQSLINSMRTTEHMGVGRQLRPGLTKYLSLGRSGSSHMTSWERERGFILKDKQLYVFAFFFSSIFLSISYFYLVFNWRDIWFFVIFLAFFSSLFWLVRLLLAIYSPCLRFRYIR